jgi:hypothetical protein
MTSRYGRPAGAAARLLAYLPALCCVVLLTAGCTQTLVFLEDSSFKLGISVNDDPTTPLEVTAGVRRKVLSVTPPKEPMQTGPDGKSMVSGEPVNLVSRFDVRYAEGGAGPFGGTLRITNSFASGEAARTVAGDKTAMSAILGVKLLDPLSRASFDREATNRRRAMLARIDTLPSSDAISLATNPPTPLNPSMQTLAGSIDPSNQRQRNAEAAKAVLKAWLSQAVEVDDYPKWAAALR